MPDFPFNNPRVRGSAKIFVQAFIEACAKSGVKDPADALVNTDCYPRLRKISEVEYMVGWLHGCAEAHGIKVQQLWRELAPAAQKRVDALTRRAA